MVKNPPANAEDTGGFSHWVGTVSWMATHSSILAGKVLWTEEPSWLQSMWLQKVRHD